jgi:hypothetical protein
LHFNNAGITVADNMSYRTLLLRVGLLVGGIVLLFVPLRAAAATPSIAELQITQLNITGDEYVTIQNSGPVAFDLSNYWVGYVSSDTSTAVPAQQLPAVTLQPLETIVLNNGSAATCGAVAVDDLGFSLSNTAGTIALWRLDSAPGGPASFAFLDAVSWGKNATSPTYLKIADETNVAKFNADKGTPTWLHAATTWQVGDMQGCVFTPVVSSTVTQPPISVDWPIGDETPPFTILAPVSVSAGSGSSRASIPAADIGLKALVLSEILPNPASPKTDADDEFIELYNPNNKVFDLSGFKLQIASTTSSTVHSYTIPTGTTIAPKGFKAFMSASTNLALNNSGGQVWLVDPLDHTVVTTGVYGGVKEGAAWINTSGKWQWTQSPTPGASNKLQAVVGSTGKGKTASVNGRTITGLTNTGSKGVAGASTAGAYDAATQTVPLHPSTLAAVVALALLYLAYEYRRDVANKFQQFRENRTARS